VSAKAHLNLALPSINSAARTAINVLAGCIETFPDGVAQSLHSG
jgi:hypothetical protein